MAIDRTTITAGPARVEYDGEVFFSKGPVTIDVGSETSPTNTEKWGKVDEVILEPLYSIKFEPVGEWEALEVLFPLSKIALGASIFPAADKTLTVLDASGNRWFFKNAAVRGEPQIRFAAEETLLGEVEFVAIRTNDTAWSVVDALVEVTTGETVPSDTEFALANILRQGYAVAWGETSPWDDFDTEDGLILESRPSFFPIATDNCGQVDIRLQGYEVVATFTPLGPSSDDMLGLMGHQGSGAARGISLASPGNLNISGDGLYMSMINAAPRNATGRFGSVDLRLGQMEAVSTAANFSGPAFYVADLKEPDELSGLLFDFNPESGLTESGGVVEDWVDAKSSVTATQATVGQRPLLVDAYQNGLDAIYFDGTDDFLQTSGVSVESQPLTLFFVVKPDSDCAVAHSFFDGGNGSASFNFARSSLSPSTRFSMAAPTPVRSDDGYENAQFNLLTAVAATSASYVRVNGAANGSVGDTGSSSLDDMTLGAARTGAGGLKGHMLRVLVYDGELSAANILKVERYLTAAYALPRTIIPV